MGDHRIWRCLQSFCGHLKNDKEDHREVRVCEDRLFVVVEQFVAEGTERVIGLVVSGIYGECCQNVLLMSMALRAELTPSL